MKPKKRRGSPKKSSQFLDRISLKDVLALHDKNASTISLKDYLCDGYLMSVNPGLRNLREAVLKIGYQFSTSAPKEYYWCPLLGLGPILETKTIPYFDTVTVLRRLESIRNGHFPLSELSKILELYTLKKSPFVHESFHCLGEYVFEEILGDRTKKPERPINERVFEILLGEAFANAGEAYLNIFERDQLQDFLFVKYFAQVSCPPQILKHLRYFASKFGHQFVYRMLVFSYLAWNFLEVEFGKREMKVFVPLIAPPQPLSKSDAEKIITIVKKFVFMMDSRAAVYTAHYYTRLMGHLPFESPEDYLENVGRMNFVDIYYSNPKYREIIENVAAAMAKGLDSVALTPRVKIAA